MHNLACFLLGLVALAVGLLLLFLIGSVPFRLMDGSWPWNSDGGGVALILGLVTCVALPLFITLVYMLGCGIRSIL